MNIKFERLPLIFFLTALLAIAACTEESKQKELKKETPVPVHVAVPILQAGESITVSGQLEAQETAIISTRVMGFISSVAVAPGDKIEKGQLLVAISNADMQAKRAQAQAMTEETEAAVKDARKDYDRFDELYNQQSASSKEFENARLRYNSLKAKAESAQQMRNEADAILAYTDLVAPFSGVVTQKHTSAGNMANPGMPLLTIENNDSYQVRAFVSESEVGKLSTGMSVTVTLKSTRQVLAGRISEISSSSQFTGGQFQIKVMVSASGVKGLFSGMYANIVIPLKNYSGVQRLFVPVAAIHHEDQLSGLYTVSDDQTAHLRWLKVGKEQGDQVEILSGLSPGERFVTQRESRLYNGAPVVIKKSSELTLAK
jgi:RND family efflux transporter MFP subunit